MAALYAVFGRPIAHSRSPRIHQLFARQLGLELDYRAIEAGPDELPQALEHFAAAGGRGANLTLPLKTHAVALCASLSERAHRCGSVNTLLPDGAGWRGDSTDGIGLLVDLRERQRRDPQGRRVLLLGAGGAARAVAFALVEAGVGELWIANRSAERAQALAAELDSRAKAVPLAALAGLGEVDLLLNASAAGHAGESIELPASLCGDHSLAYDLSYGKAAGPFLDAALRAGVGRIMDGLGMLIEQAAESFALWHGQRPETESIYATLRSEGEA